MKVIESMNVATVYYTPLHVSTHDTVRKHRFCRISRLEIGECILFNSRLIWATLTRHMIIYNIEFEKSRSWTRSTFHHFHLIYILNVKDVQNFWEISISVYLISIWLEVMLEKWKQKAIMAKSWLIVSTDNMGQKHKRHCHSLVW